jgi:hypothetical protein
VSCRSSRYMLDCISFAALYDNEHLRDLCAFRVLMSAFRFNWSLLTHLQGFLEQKMQKDTLAFEQQLASINVQLKQKEGELQEAADRFSKLQTDSEARNNQLCKDLQAAQHSIEVLQANAKKAGQLHEVGNA